MTDHELRLPTDTDPLTAHRAFQSWRARARPAGGWAWRRTALVWVATLPEGATPPKGSAPMRSLACTRAA